MKEEEHHLSSPSSPDKSDTHTVYNPGGGRRRWGICTRRQKIRKKMFSIMQTLTTLRALSLPLSQRLKVVFVLRESGEGGGRSQTKKVGLQIEKGRSDEVTVNREGGRPLFEV